MILLPLAARPKCSTPPPVAVQFAGVNSPGLALSLPRAAGRVSRPGPKRLPGTFAQVQGDMAVAVGDLGVLATAAYLDAEARLLRLADCDQSNECRVAPVRV